MLFVDRAHQCGRWWENLVDEDEDGFLGRELDALTDHIDELADGEICRNEVFLLVDSCDIRLLDFLADHLGNEILENIRLVQRLRGRLTGMRSAYFARIRSASALRFSKGCSSLNLDRMLTMYGASGRRRCMVTGAVVCWR